jgi:hypothetical protein
MKLTSPRAVREAKSIISWKDRLWLALEYALTSVCLQSVKMVHFTQALATALLAVSVVAHPGGNTNREILRRQAHLDHPYRRSVQECKRDLVESGWVREQHLRREARLHELRVAAGFAKEHEIVRRDPAEIEENYGAEAACTLDPEATEGPYCAQNYTVIIT